MPSVEMRPDVYWIGLNDRTTDLFEGIWPVSHEGVTYNSYLVRDEKKVIIDLAKGFKTDEYFERIDALVPLSEIDYIVVNHMEPDHTGAVRALVRIPRKLTIIATEKAREMLAAFYGITDNVRVVADGEELPIGRRTLKFVHVPFVHWPETMVTYDATDRILFSCDAFGGYGALPGTIFDDQCSDLVFYEREALRYYVNIVAKFSAPTLAAIEKLAGIPIDIIAPSHGLVWRRDPGRIVELYRQWAQLAQGNGEKGVTLVYGSMYGNTEKMMNAVAQGISRAGLPVEIFDAARVHASYILPALWTYRGVMVGAPTYEGSLFPPVAQAIEIAALKRIVNKKAAIFGSYGWSKGGMAAFRKLVEPLKWDITDTLEFRGSPTALQLKQGEELGERFAAVVKTP
ncbi:MAG TPA: FprA family A-type flavoprotein [Spirochaetia bacterium]|nr:FprA family A-type flavoprotein [Spirochaetia bacterium]